MSRICGSCGSVNEDTNKYCSVCGTDLTAENVNKPTESVNNTSENTYYQQNFNNEPATREISGAQKFGWGALGCCVPIVGLILWLVWSKDRPEEARCLRNGFFVCLAAYALYFIAIFGFMFIGISLSA